MPNFLEIKEGIRFDLFADAYDVNRGQYPIRTIVRARVIEVVRKHAPRVVVDVGCGTGTALIELSDHITTGIGLDVSRRMVAVAAWKARLHRCENLQFQFGSFHDLNGDHDFWASECAPDLFMQNYAMHHLTQAEKREVLASMACALDSTRDGMIVLGDLMFFEDPRGLESEHGIVGYDPSTDRPESVDTLTQILKDLGFRVETCPIHPLAGIIVARRSGVVRGQ